MSIASTPSTHRTTADYFAGIPHFTPAAKITVYAAVIEWPPHFTDAEPALILARSDAEREAAIFLELRDMAAQFDADTWTAAIAAADSAEWRNWLPALGGTRYGQPFVTLYTKEV